MQFGCTIKNLLHKLDYNNKTTSKEDDFNQLNITIHSYKKVQSLKPQNK